MAQNHGRNLTYRFLDRDGWNGEHDERTGNFARQRALRPEIRSAASRESGSRGFVLRQGGLMLSAALLLFANTLLFSLRLSGGGSFPKPLTAAEEREWLEKYAQGDPEARQVLIERNLRLVAHIIKKE